jgi:hypothetical protein
VELDFRKKLPFVGIEVLWNGRFGEFVLTQQKQERQSFNQQRLRAKDTSEGNTCGRTAFASNMHNLDIISA